MLTNVEFYNKARYEISKKFPEVRESDIYMVWNCFILGHIKGLFSWHGDNKYIEVTYNSDKKEMYIDVYEKKSNDVVEFRKAK